MISVTNNSGFDSDRKDNIVDRNKPMFSPTSSSGAGGDGEAAKIASSRSDDAPGISGLDTCVNPVVNRSDEARVLDKENEGRVECEDTKKEHKLSDYNSMLLKFDEFASNGKTWAVGYGYEMGDMVWGKVKSHPWWPGHIYHEAFATTSVRRTKKEGHVLVAFFGDSSYGWFDPAELIPFDSNFAEKSRQTTSRTFQKAVEEALDEVYRRQGLGVACRCRNPYNFRAAKIQGYFTVDFADTEYGCTYSASQIKKARESFQPKEALLFVKKLALKPMNGEYGSLSFLKHKATLLAYRKAVFEEFDETYAQAFGAQPVRPSRPVPPIEGEQSRDLTAPLSGRMVIAETLGKGRTSIKPSKSKDQVEKDRYLFKRRDEFTELKTHKASQGQVASSGLPVQADGSAFVGKGMHPSVVNTAPSISGTSVNESSKQSFSYSTPNKEVEGRGQIQDSLGGANLSVEADAKLPGDGSRMHTDGGSNKVKARKRPAVDLTAEGSVPVEKRKKKKKKRETGLEMKVDRMEVPAAADITLPTRGKVGGDFIQASSEPRGELLLENQKKDDPANIFTSESGGTKETIGTRSVDFELSRLLSDLQSLALNPFHGAERNRPAIIRRVFLRFRSLVYQKSSPLLAFAENDSNEVRASNAPAAVPPDNTPIEHVKVTSSVKPQKFSTRPEDPTKAGRKRPPSDRQEEIAAKKKRITDLKQLAAEKRAAQMAPEAHKGESREMNAKSVASMPQKALKPETSKRMEPPARVPEPTMLVMKFPAGGALPSIAELKAKFARFGPLDHSATRVFWKTSTCRLVYRFKTHAQAAHKFAVGSPSLFGNTNVRCFLRDLGVETSEPDSTKVSKEDASGVSSQLRDPAAEQKLAARPSTQPLQQAAQLKSCLKKPSGDEGAMLNGGNGGGRGARVKFMLGGEENSREQSVGGSKNKVDNAIFADAGTSPLAMDFSKNLQKVMTPLQSSSMPPFSSQFPKAPNNLHYTTEVGQRSIHNLNTSTASFTPITNSIDIAQQMLSLLTKCNDVVNNLTGVLGYVPYHPL